jgi:hypothetical protein
MRKREALWKTTNIQQKITKMVVFWVVARFALMMEAARTSETLVNFYQTTRHYNPEDSRLHTHRRENLKSYQQKNVLSPNKNLIILIKRNVMRKWFKS